MISNDSELANECKEAQNNGNENQKSLEDSLLAAVR